MKVVQLLTTEYGELEQDKSVHLADTLSGEGNRVVCNGQVFGYGESDVQFKAREVETLRSVTCKNCLDVVNWYKSLKY